MIPRASRVLPGVLVTMLLATPVFAAHRASADPVRKTEATKVVDHRRTNGIRTHKATMAGRRRGGATYAHARTHVATTAFVDDSFSNPDGLGAGGWHQSGVASWYGGRQWQGHATSSGAPFDEARLTAAHATLPLGSRVRVSLQHSDRSVVVLINDRPGTRTRIIDLSRAAASALGMLDQGIAMVTLSPAL